MTEQWIWEIVYGVGRMFYNPLFYWFVILLIYTGLKRIKRERRNFGTKVYEVFSEVNKTWIVSLMFGLLISVISILFGLVLSWEIIIVLAVVTILLSITGSLQFLSAGYTIGITFILFMIIPFLPIGMQSNLFRFDQISQIHFISLAFLTAFLLFAEVMLLRSANKTVTYPSVALSRRGVWIGQHALKKMSIIPFLALFPASDSTAILPIFPYFHLGEHTYQIVLIPFIIGFQYKIQSERIRTVIAQLMKEKLMISFLVLIVAILSLYIPILALVAVVIALMDHEWITYRHRLHNRNKPPYFSPLNEGVKVMAVLPNSRASDLGIKVGEIILKVNGKNVNNEDEFYESLQQSGAFFKLDVLNLDGEVRFIQSAMYEEDHHYLGLLFPGPPFQQIQKEKVDQLKAL